MPFLSPGQLRPQIVVDQLLQATRSELAALGALVLLVRRPPDSEPDFGQVLEATILRSDSSPARSVPTLATAEIPTMLAPPDDESDVDQAEMLAELGAADHWICPFQLYVEAKGSRGESMVTVGRALDAQIRLTDRSVSAHHANFTLADGGVRLADLGSKNGTTHNGVELRPQEKVWLQPMDRVRFGRVECFVCDPRALRAVLRNTDSRSFQ